MKHTVNKLSAAKVYLGTEQFHFCLSVNVLEDNTPGDSPPLRGAVRQDSPVRN
ncbi:hypothetical protein J6590_083062 [Homalodisca vitripennis]|nr:hypothetical protein J6590_083062 [Homalodisca vitripennis]